VQGETGVRRGRELACGAGQVCARRAQERSVTDGAGSAGAAEHKRKCGARAEVGGAGGAAERLRFGGVEAWARERGRCACAVRAVAYGSWWSATWSSTQRAGVQALGGQRTGGASNAGTRVRARSDAARPGKHRFGSRKRRSSCTASRTMMCREVTRNAKEVAMRRLQTDLPREQ
jgi:hypothetical protein